MCGGRGWPRSIRAVLELTPDQLLSTTRAVRKRLDLTRPVDPQLIKECLELALQAPSGSNRQNWQFVVVTDPEPRRALAELYKKAFTAYANSPQSAGSTPQLSPEREAIQQRVRGSAFYLADHLHEVPVHLIPCFMGRVDGLPGAAQAGTWGSILPATWSFMLAARARGLGTAWTTLHLVYEKAAAEVLGIPYDEVTQAGLIPVAHTKGTDFAPAPRDPLDRVVHWDHW